MSLAVEGQNLSISGNTQEAYHLGNARPEFVLHLIGFSVGDQDTDKNFPVADTENPDGNEKVEVCGLMTMTHWNMKVGGTLNISGIVLEQNQAKLLSVASKPKPGTVVKFNFVCYKHNSADDTYFKFFHTNDEMIEGVISKDGPLMVDQYRSNELQGQIAYGFSLGIVGSDTKDQNLHFCPSPTAKEVVAFSRAKQ